MSWMIMCASSSRTPSSSISWSFFRAISRQLFSRSSAYAFRRSMEFTRILSSTGSIGLWRKSSAPASMATIRSSHPFRSEVRMTGICRVSS